MKAHGQWGSYSSYIGHGKHGGGEPSLAAVQQHLASMSTGAVLHVLVKALGIASTHFQKEPCLLLTEQACFLLVCMRSRLSGQLRLPCLAQELHIALMSFATMMPMLILIGFSIMLHFTSVARVHGNCMDPSLLPGSTCHPNAIHLLTCTGPYLGLYEANRIEDQEA